MGRVDFEKELNTEQRQVAQAPDGPVLVLAAAGTGKTRALTYRVSYLVEKGVDPARILLLTFTNRAAQEMLARARQLVGGAVGEMWGGTFHHMANKILRRHATRLNYTNDYTILDSEDAKHLARDCVKERKPNSKLFPKPAVLMSLFGLAANTGRPLEDLVMERFLHPDTPVDDIVYVHRQYEKKKRDLNGMDFDDLLCNALKLFREHTDLREMYQQRFQHVLVDEYQDTNKIQAEWVDLLAGRHGNILVVGDDFQSIYSWRGADFRNIMSFPERYGGTKIYKLETNYRSTPQILAVANACIAGNPDQYQKVLRPIREDTQKPILASLHNGSSQARYIAEQLISLKAQGYRGQDIAVLYRSHFHAMDLQMEFTRQSIPYVITSGVRFFEQVHIKDVCALARLARTPSDELSFRRLLEFLPRVGPKTALKIWTTLGGRFDVWDPAQRKQVADRLPKQTRELWENIAEVFEELADRDHNAQPELLMEAFLKAFYDDYVRSTFEKSDRRLDDLQALIRHATDYKTLDDFLNEVALMTNLDQHADKFQAAAEDTIRLTTIHQAKGLEWGVVFILWLVEGQFPAGRSLDDPAGDAEERRLFYVATTRAKDKLFLCCPQYRRTRDRREISYCIKSRFVQEIPEELFDEQVLGYV